jgi:cell division protein FtsN
MARKEPRAAQREDTPRKSKGGGMFTGLVIGLVIGLVAAAGLAWYFNLGANGFKAVDTTPPVAPPPLAAKPPASRVEPAPAPHAEAPSPSPAEPTPRRIGPPRVDYTFYGILPGDKPVKPIEPPKSRESWWLQVAALKSPLDADKLKARLALLGLDVSTQKVENAGQALYRVRVGPYKREDDALGDLDILAQNNFEPRLLKEPLKPKE